MSETDLDKQLDRMLAKCESAKADLDRNWALQISSIAASIALLAGLGEELAEKFIGTDRYDLLFVALPVVSTYLFVRFGSLAGTFSKARHAAERLTRATLGEGGLADGVDAGIIYETNSQFEYVHHPFSPAKFLFSLTIPFIFALNHTTTILGVYVATQRQWYFWIFLLAYVAVAAACYTIYYRANRDNTALAVRGQQTFLRLVALASLLMTLFFLAAGRNLAETTLESLEAKSRACAQPDGRERPCAREAGAVPGKDGDSR